MDARFGFNVSKWDLTRWHKGVVRCINEDGTLAIDYDDGDQEERVLRKHVRPPKAKARPPSPLASTSSGRLRTAPQRLDASLLVASSRSCASAGGASTLGAEDSDEEESDEGSDEELGAPATLTADAVDLAGAAAAAVRQAEAEGLTLQPSDNATGYRGVHKDSHHGRTTTPELTSRSRKTRVRNSKKIRQILHFFTHLKNF